MTRSRSDDVRDVRERLPMGIYKLLQSLGSATTSQLAVESHGTIQAVGVALAALERDGMVTKQKVYLAKVSRYRWVYSVSARVTQ